MTYQILNGDALVDRFLAAGLPGQIIVARECLIEGDLSGETLDSFYLARANYLTEAYTEVNNNYLKDVAGEFEKLRVAPSPSEFNLWFGYDLFCRANMWFILSLLNDLPIDKQVFVVYPSHLKGDDVWLDFGMASLEQLKTCYSNRIAFTEKDLQLGNELWSAYKYNDFSALEKLSKYPSACFPYLKEVCQAHIDRFAEGGRKGRPERVIEELLEGSEKDFPSVFKAFSKREGIYGFGDSQLKKIYDNLIGGS
ncbi:DUF1835 domain-containing protein [Pedobacter sp. HMF7647]|uniref:DUF1835 domain-containing protein n=1 Tax=Hufsiella arboris TaxID=2695275 RepID=A0A7K1Y7N0_9SPHI|nr:DUF1835 domain-containing protein [Hufsiella arboris]MXV50129.1 DUF1835 domain-containing protein [Hufsiella arboris]